MRLIAPLMLIGWIVVAGAAPASPRLEDIHGQLSITRVLTKQRVTVPDYTVRGVSPGKPTPNANPLINEWERVAVYLEGQNAPRATPVTVTLGQSGQRFDPDTAIAPVGSTGSFPNFDPIFHNVFSLSKARQFDLGNYPAGTTRTVKFDTPGVVQVFCHLHPDMNAAILIVPNAWYTRPDNQGTFSFSGIPPGPYQIVVWHRSAGFFRKSVQVTAGGGAKVSMEIPLSLEEGKR